MDGNVVSAMNAEVSRYLVLSEDYCKINHYDEAISYGKKCIDMAKTTGDKHDEMNACLVIGKAYSELGQYDGALCYGKRCIGIAKEINDKNTQMKAYLVIGQTFKNSEQYDDAIQYTRLCLEIANENDAKTEEIKAYDLLGEAHLNLSLYEDAILYYEVSLDISKEIEDKQSEMMTHLSMGKGYNQMTQYVRSIRCVRMCLDIAKEIGDKHVEMKGCLAISESYQDLKQYDEAIKYAKMCLEITNETDSKDLKIQAYNLLGMAQFGLAQYEDALSYHKVGLDIAREIGDKKAEMEACLSIGGVHGALDHYDEAIQYARSYLDFAQENNSDAFIKETYIFLGYMHLRLGQCEDARSCFKMVVKIAETQGIKYEKVTVPIGNTFMLTEQHHNASSYWQRCIDEATENGDKEDLKMAYFHLGETYFKLNKYDDSDVYYKKAIDVAKETEDRETEMKVCLQLAETVYLLNQNEEAMTPAKKALCMAKEISDKNVEMRAYSLLINLHRKLYQDSDVISCTNELIATAKEAGDVDREFLGSLMEFTGSLKTINKISDISDKHQHLVDECVSNLLEVPFQLVSNSEDITDHYIYILQGYLTTIIKVHNDPEIIRRMFEATSQNLKLNYPIPRVSSLFGMIEEKLKVKTDTAGRNPLKLNLIDCFTQKMQTMNQNETKCSFEDAMLSLQEWFQFYLISTFMSSSVDSQAVCHSGVGMINYILGNKTAAKEALGKSIACFESAFVRLHDVDQSKITTVDKYVDTYKLLSKMLIEENQKEEALLISERCRAQALNDLLRLKYGMKQDVAIENGGQIQLTDIQSLVSINNFSILFYSLCINDLHTFSLDGKDLHFSSQSLQNSSTYNLEQYIHKAFAEMKVRQVLNCENFNQNTQNNQETRETSAQSSFDLNYRGETSGTSDESSLISALEVIYKKLLDKVPSEQDEIVFIPDGSLFNVPFAALRDPDTGRYLSEDKKIRIAPSLTTLKLLSKCPAEFNMMTGALVIGDPTVGRVKLNGVEMTVPPLESARAEAIVIASNLGVTPLKEKEATKPAVIKKLQQGVSVVHIAAHGNLQKATILLAPSPETRASKELPDEEDYMLTMADVQKARVRAQLVVLSCCYSGRGEIRAEGVVGMCRAFLASGARAVVASLWAISDDATLDFMTYFYLHLKNGKSASTSLQMAMKVIRDDEEYSEPKYWAPFFLMGDDVTVRF